MPISEYFHGGGNKVMENMTKEYGPEKGKQVFYATAQKRKVKPMFAGGVVGARPYWELPEDEDQPIMPQMEMDPTQPPEMLRSPTQLSRLAPPQMEPPDAPPNMGGAVAPPSMDAAAPTPTMPDMDPAAMGRTPAYRAGLINERMRQDETPAPGGLRNQGGATDRYLQMARDVQAEKPKLWQQIGKAVLPGVDWNPNITRHRQNLVLQGRAADEERKQQVAQANEELKRDTLLNSQSNRRYNDDYHKAQEANLQSQIEDRTARQKEQELDRNIKLGAAGAYEIPDQTASQEIPGMLPGTGNVSATLPAAKATPANAYAFKDPVTGRRMAIPNKQDTYEFDAESGQALGLKPGADGRYVVPKTALPSLVRTLNASPKNTKAEDIEETVAAKEEIANKRGLKGAERQHFIYGTPMPAAQSGTGPSAPPADIKPGSREFKIAQDLAYGKLTMQQFRSMLSYSRDVNKKMDIYSKASDLNPNFNPSTFEMGFTLAKNPKVQQQLAAMDNVQAGIPDLLKASDEAKRSGVTMLNKFIIPGGIAFGSKKYSNLAAARLGFADELSGALGFGSATDMSRQMGLDMTNPNLSHENFMSAVQDVVLPFVQRKRATLLKQMGIYGEQGMNPAAEQAPPEKPQGGAGQQGGGAQGGGGGNIREQQSPSTGQYRHSVDGGKSWLPGRAPRQ